MTPPVLTLITPTYNRASTLLETLENYRLQSHPDVELIVVDDGSTDETCDAVQFHHPEVTLLRSEKREGPSIARNLGLEHARGAYIMPLDSDCFLPPGTLEFLVSFLKTRPTGLYLFPCRSWPDGKPSTTRRDEHPVTLEQLLLKELGEVIPLIPVKLLNLHGLRFPRHFAGGEPYVLLQLLTLQEALFVPRIILEYRTDTSMRISSPDYQIRYPLEISEVLESTLPFYSHCQSDRARRHYARTLEKIGIYHILGGKAKHARWWLTRALENRRLSAVIFLLLSLLPRQAVTKLFLCARETQNKVLLEARKSD